MTYDEINEICETYEIRKWSLNEETGLVDVDGDVDLSGERLTELPLNFGNVKGDFLCYRNKLTTLKGVPISVSCDFHCANNKLTSLKGIPKHIGGDFYSYDNNIPMWEHRWILYSEIGGNIKTNNEKLEDFLNINKNPPKSDLPKLFAELKKLGAN